MQACRVSDRLYAGRELYYSVNSQIFKFVLANIPVSLQQTDKSCFEVIF